MPSIDPTHARVRVDRPRLLVAGHSVSRPIGSGERVGGNQIKAPSASGDPPSATVGGRPRIAAIAAAERLALPTPYQALTLLGLVAHVVCTLAFDLDGRRGRSRRRPAVSWRDRSGRAERPAHEPDGPARRSDRPDAARLALAPRPAAPLTRRAPRDPRRDRGAGRGRRHRGDARAPSGRRRPRPRPARGRRSRPQPATRLGGPALARARAFR
jgi:hypothetical protein